MDVGQGWNVGDPHKTPPASCGSHCEDPLCAKPVWGIPLEQEWAAGSSLSLPVPQGMSLPSVLPVLGMSLRWIFPTCLQIPAQVWLPSLPGALWGWLEPSQSCPRATGVPPGPRVLPGAPGPTHGTHFATATVRNDTTKATSTAKVLSLSSSAPCNRLGGARAISCPENIP